MRKLVRIIAKLFKAIYNFFDKKIVTPISKIIYRINTKLKKKSGGLEKVLHKPNVLLYASLVLAVIVFFLVDSKAISLVENQSEVITNVPLTIRYNEEAYVVEGAPEQVDLILMGRKSDIYLSKQLGEHGVILDLTDYEPSSSSYKVNLSYTKSISSLTYKLDPSYVTVTIKPRVSERFDISYDLVNTNKLDSKLSVKSVELSKTEIVAKGSQDTLDSIASIKALIDLSDSSYNEAGTYNIDNVPIVAYDAEGNTIDNITIVPASLSATVTLDSYSTSVPLQVSTTGDLVTGKAIASILINNSSSFAIDIYGEQDKISDIKNVVVTIDVDGFGNQSSKSYNATIPKPNGVRYMSASNANITVTFGEEKQKTIEISDIKYKNLGEGYSANATKNTSLQVQVKGVQSVIDSINPENISAYVDLSGLGEGDYELDVNFENVDSRIKLVSLSKMNIKITKD